MARISLPELQIIYRDLWKMQTLYRMTRHWFLENEYADLKGDITMESAMEVLYLTKFGSHQDPNEKELRIWWRTKKQHAPLGTAGSVFYEHRMDIDFWVIKMVDREIMLEGRKEKVQYGELKIVIKPYIEVSDLSKTPVLKYFDYWFRTRLIKKNLEENRKMLYQDAYRLQGTLKKFLELKTWMPKEEAFHEKFEFI